MGFKAIRAFLNNFRSKIAHDQGYAPDQGLVMACSEQDLMQSVHAWRSAFGIYDRELLDHCKYANDEGVATALKNGANPHVVDESKFTALHVAASSFGSGKKTSARAANICRMLLALGVDPNGHNNIKQTPLHLAATFGHDDVCAFLLAAGSDVNAADQCKRTPLHDAAWKGRHSLIDLFMSAGADIHTRDNTGDTVLHAGAFEGCALTFQKLIDYGADLCAVDEDGDTPLHLTALYDRPDLCRVLVANGADIHAVNPEGTTPIDMARGEALAYLETVFMEANTAHVTGPSRRQGRL